MKDVEDDTLPSNLSDLTTPSTRDRLSLKSIEDALAIVENTSKQPSFRVRQPINVIATYMNTIDNRAAVKADLLRSHSHVSSPANEMQPRVRTNSALSRDSSAEWGWFADIDSSGESFGENSITNLLRRKYSTDFLPRLESAGSLHVLYDESTTSRMTAALKTFPCEDKTRVQGAAISIPKFRIVQSRSGTDRHAEYLVCFKLGREYYADWRRYSEFNELVKDLDITVFPRTMLAWKNIDNRWFNRLEPEYLHKKCVALEIFVRDLMYELTSPDIMISFLGGENGRMNNRPGDIKGNNRPSAQLPKEMRPPQPQQERELFEKLWAENFKRSSVTYTEEVTK